MIKQCQLCGHEFEGVHNAKYCPDCRREVKRKRAHLWYLQHRELQIERVKRWKRENPEANREINRRYRERVKRKLWREILTAANRGKPND